MSHPSSGRLDDKIQPSTEEEVPVGQGFSLAFNLLEMIGDSFANLSCLRQIPRNVRGKGLPYI